MMNRWIATRRVQGEFGGVEKETFVPGTHLDDCYTQGGPLSSEFVSEPPTGTVGGPPRRKGCDGIS